MPAQDSTEVRLAPFGDVFIGPLGTPLPTSPTAALDVGFIQVGLVSPDGVSLTPSVNTTDINAWQKLVPVKTTLTGIGLTVKFNMIQVNQETTSEYFFGNTWVNLSGAGKLDFSSSPSLQERSLVVQWEDDEANNNRFVFGRGTFTDRDAFTLVRSAATALGITFECLDNAGSLGYLLSNDPDLIPAT